MSGMVESRSGLSAETAPAVACETLLHRQKSAAARQTHAHVHQFFWVTKGGGRATIDGMVKGFGPSTAAFVPALTTYGFDFTPGSQGWVVSLSPGLAEVPALPLISTVTQMADQSQLSVLFDSIDREIRAGRAMRERALECHAGLLAVWFLRHQEAAGKAVLPRDSARRRLMKRFIELLNERYRAQDSVADYARALSVTTTHLTRVCRQTTGHPASALIQDRVLEDARSQLRHSTLKVNQIARSLGFDNAAYFSRLFAQKTGTSPIGYRSQARRGLT
jgi:AraC-like DNA-binding protein